MALGRPRIRDAVRWSRWFAPGSPPRRTIVLPGIHVDEAWLRARRTRP
ncbi:hypothetical protein [uncultured Tessaracoccus sp.]|nr:hypothetical protein [uncultured Tessaracoccus sp.]